MFDSQPFRLVGCVLGLAVVLTVMALCFGLPTVHSGAHNLEVGITGNQQAVHRVEDEAAKAAPGTYRFEALADEPAVRKAIENRHVIGGVVAGRDRTSVLIATAAGGPLAQTMRGLALGLGHATGRDVPIDDVVPYTSADPMGGGISSAGLPLIFGGILPALVLGRLFRRRPGLRIAGALSFSLLAGLVVASLLQFVYGTIDQNFWLVAGGVALGLAAISLPALGLEAAFGVAGFAALSVTMVLVANPLSGLSTSSAWLPSPWGSIGQLLPPGASGTVLRSNAFFDGRGASAQLVVLICWALVGCALCGLTALQARRHSTRELVAAVA